MKYKKLLIKDTQNNLELALKEKYNVGFSEEDKKELYKLINMKTKKEKEDFEDLKQLPSDICEFLQELDEKITHHLIRMKILKDC
ncbi:hypothetical protein A500_16895 [Clostridium sartagoforme AAU1]|uniref:Uncharacterized protein n=1 Tax=Clostridium sartagoforme AAU1 TaxID=1202534 RepID=R9BUT3_9CLOT|nr:hypothetical protein [Clostridium sartagoforme]EOR20460.1 hypothetical protein A500_16895 [Clostridium sartagoforme AAU1]